MHNKKQFINAVCILFSLCFIGCINKKTQTAEFENTETNNTQDIELHTEINELQDDETDNFEGEYIFSPQDDNQSIFINNEKITLRYSTRNDVEELLGKPEKIEYFEHGIEDFFWKNFTVCSYDEDKLRFHYDQNGAIIRMTVNAGYSGEVQFLGMNIKTLMKKDILNVVKTFDYKNPYISNDFIMYDHVLSLNNIIQYSFWFDNAGKIKWVDMYYPSPWE